MKYIFHISVTLVLAFATMGSKAQTWDEIFNQKKTQIKYLTEQIIALKVQIGYIQKGYKVAKDGLDFIGKATKGEFDLHDDFFKSLKKINPEVSRYPQVKQITQLHTAIQESQQQYSRRIDETATLRAQEMEYISVVFSRITADCERVERELEQVLSAGRLEMKDDERITRINALHKQMQENYLITVRFGQGTLQLALSRKAEKVNIENSRKINKTNE